MKEGLLFSVLIANYNNGEFIEETIDSILKQTYKNIEIIIVDDASTDNSLAIIKSKIKNIPPAKLILNSRNKGCGYTKNRCVQEAKGTICGFVDPEDTIAVNAVEVMINKHEENINASMVFSNYFHCNERLEIISLRKPKIKEGIVNFSQLYERKINHFATFKRELYLTTEGIQKDLKRAVDQDLYIKLEEVGAVYYVDKNLYFYRYHDKGISAFGNNYKALYWYFQVKDKTCTRRGLFKEDYFSDEYEKLINHYKNTIDFKVGNLILKPVRHIIKLTTRLKEILK